MAQAYFSLVTNAGKIKLAQSAAGGYPIVITHFAIGDGNGADTNPTAASTALVREVWRTPVESVVTDPDNPSAVLVTAIIPTTAGGWWMREMGIFDQAGTMIAVARPVSQYKPTALEGQLEDIRYEFQLIIGESANVTLLVDPSLIFATRTYVDTRKVPMSQLSRLPWLPIISMTLPSAPGAPTQGDVYLVPTGATGIWAAQVGKIAEWAGNAWSYLTPPDGHGISLPDGRVFMRIAAVYLELKATEARHGLVKLASVNMAKAGTDTESAVTPAGLAAAMPISSASAQFSPIHATILTANNRATITSPAAGQIDLAAFSFLWRDFRTVEVAAQSFPTVANKVYHLRAAYNHGTGVVVVTLQDLASAAYNPTAAAESDPLFDATFDNILLATISTSAGNVATILPLKASASMTVTAKNTAYTESSVSVAVGWLSSPFITANFNRTPKVTLSSFNFDSGPNVEMANRIETRATRYSFQVDCFGYGVVLSGAPTSASLVGYRFITGIWEATAIA